MMRLLEASRQQGRLNRGSRSVLGHEAEIAS